MAESGWSDELKQRVISMYLDYEPTPDNSMEMVKEVVKDLKEDGIDKTVNGVRMILSKADAYIKKTPAAKVEDKDKKPKKMSKADAVKNLRNAILDVGADVDDGIIGKMTGIAAEYFTGVINASNR